MKLNNLFTILFSSVLISSCNFLETEPLDFKLKEQIYKTIDDANKSLTGIYRIIMFQYGGNYTTRVSATDDLCFYDEDMYPIGVYNNNYLPSDAEIADFWKELYEGINNANVLLEEISNIPIMKEEDKDKLVSIEGETRFLRAFAYFLLAQLRGSIQIVP